MTQSRATVHELRLLRDVNALTRAGVKGRRRLAASATSSGSGDHDVIAGVPRSGYLLNEPTGGPPENPPEPLSDTQSPAETPERRFNGRYVVKSESLSRC